MKIKLKTHTICCYLIKWAQSSYSFHKKVFFFPTRLLMNSCQFGLKTNILNVNSFVIVFLSLSFNLLRSIFCAIPACPESNCMLWGRINIFPCLSILDFCHCKAQVIFLEQRQWKRRNTMQTTINSVNNTNELVKMILYKTLFWHSSDLEI